MADKKRIIQVFADWETMPEPQLMGLLSATQIRGKKISAFEYEKHWLKENQDKHSLDPDLNLYGGQQYLLDTKYFYGFISRLFGAFIDA